MTLKERLAKFMRAHHGWISSGELQRIVAEKTLYSPSNATRRLRELAEEGILERQLRRGHAYYRLKEAEPTLF